MKKGFDFDLCGPPSHVFRIQGLNGAHMECRPVTAPPPPDGTIGFLYRQQGDTLTQYCAGIFKEGKWSRLSGKLKHEPSHWVVMVDDTQ